MTENERLQDALQKISRRVYAPEDLLHEYENEYAVELVCGMTPEAAHLLAIHSVNERSRGLRGKKLRGGQP